MPLVSQKSASAHARALRRPRRELGCQMERRSWPKPPRPRAEAPASGLPCWDEQYLRMCAQKMKQYSANKCIFQWWPLNQNTLLSMFDRSKTTYQTPLPLIADIKIGNMSFTYLVRISNIGTMVIIFDWLLKWWKQRWNILKMLGIAWVERTRDGTKIGFLFIFFYPFSYHHWEGAQPQSMEWTGSIRWIHNPVQSRRIWIGLDQKFTNSTDSGLDWIQKCAMCISYLETWGNFSLS